MKSPSIHMFDKTWPSQDLEWVKCCPLCRGVDATLEFEAVEDRSFYAAAGRWNYWRCRTCRSLFLNPRPTEASVHRTYASYYTHIGGDPTADRVRGFFPKVMRALKNGYINASLGARFSDHLTLPGSAYSLIGKMGLLPRSALNDLKNRPPGVLLDIGCGDGKFLSFARAVGWQTVGIEIDKSAAAIARSTGLKIIDGSYTKLADIREFFDAIVCSHVVEHVYDVQELIRLAWSRLRDGGEFWLQWPNPSADGLGIYKTCWRGLEAPRHITLPSARVVLDIAKRESGRNDLQYLDTSAHWLWSQMSMYDASEAMQHGKLLTRVGLNASALWRYVSTRHKIRECELCVLTITK